MFSFQDKIYLIKLAKFQIITGRPRLWTGGDMKVVNRSRIFPEYLDNNIAKVEKLTLQGKSPVPGAKRISAQFVEDFTPEAKNMSYKDVLEKMMGSRQTGADPATRELLLRRLREKTRGKKDLRLRHQD